MPEGAAAQPADRRFRPEIEGLRAVAAVLVAVYHVFLGRVSGGVDVFFVVAGFLITTTLLGHITRSGGVHPAQFFSRLAARLTPMAILVLGIVLVASILWMPVTRVDRVLREVAASALYVENWALARQAVDYLARGAAMSPVQHFWALSIQGQFYLIWLALFGGVALVARRLHRDARPLLGAAIALVFVGSLAFSIWLTERNQPLAYFHTGTRMWEFAAGGMLALALPRLGVIRRLPRWVGTTAGWIGLGMIVSCGLLLTVSSSFPGWVALWPITGGLLVILAGEAPGGTGRWSSTRLLGSRPFVFLGGVSYALYLWHWPILVFYRSRAGEGPVEAVPGLAILGLAVMLAIVTTFLVERPIRATILPRLRPWPTVLAGGAGLVLVAGAAFGATRLDAPQASATVDIGGADYPGAAAMVPGFVYQGDDVPFAPNVTRAARDLPRSVTNRCHLKLGATRSGADGAQQLADALVSEACSFGDPASDVDVVMVGGSHVAQWFTAVEAIARERGWHVTSLTKSGCRFSGDPGGTGDENRACAAWNAAALREISSLRPDLVITTATVTSAEGEHVEDGAVANWRTLGAAGIPVVAIRDNPRWESSPLDCLAINMGDPERCAVARSRSMAPEDPTSAVPDLPSSVTFVDLTNYLCEGDRCPAVIGNVVVNYDDHHLSASYVRTLTPMLDARLPVVSSGD